MVNKPLIRPYFCGGYVRGGGGRLTSHDLGGETWKLTPPKTNGWNPLKWRFGSDDFPFQLGDF